MCNTSATSVVGNAATICSFSQKLRLLDHLRKASFHYTRGIVPKRVTSAGSHAYVMYLTPAKPTFVLWLRHRTVVAISHKMAFINPCFVRKKQCSAGAGAMFCWCWVLLVLVLGSAGAGFCWYWVHYIKMLPGSSPRLRASSTQLRRYVAAVASRRQHCVWFDRPGNRTPYLPHRWRCALQLSKLTG